MLRDIYIKKPAVETRTRRPCRWARLDIRDRRALELGRRHWAAQRAPRMGTVCRGPQAQSAPPQPADFSLIYSCGLNSYGTQPADFGHSLLALCRLYIGSGWALHRHRRGHFYRAGLDMPVLQK